MLTTDTSRTRWVYRRTGADGMVYAGMYMIDGNRLTTCSPGGDQPPDDFTARTDDGEGRQTMEFERVK